MITHRFGLGQITGVVKRKKSPPRIIFSKIIFTIILFMSIVPYAQLPAGFVLNNVSGNVLSNPLSIGHAADGRIFIAEKGGAIKVIRNGITSTVTTIAVANVNEQGLLGLALHPNFSSNGRLYIYYTNASNTFHRLDMLTISSANQVTATQNLLQFDPISAPFHNGGAMAFMNGFLFLGIGDNTNNLNASNLDTYYGKILRLTEDGQPAPGNPFYSTAGASRQRRSIWAYGFRNPWSLSIDRVRNRLYVNDVGTGWEEMNDVTTPDPSKNYNYGWGTGGDGAVNSTRDNTIPPVFTYATGSIGCALTSGMIYSPTVATNYPSQYIDRYFIADWCRNWIQSISVSNPMSSLTMFGTNANFGSILSMSIGIDGNIYFVRHDQGALYRIEYTVQNAPSIVNQPTSRTVNSGDPFSFSITASGAAPLSYQWQLNGVNIAGATSANYAVTAASSAMAGSYRCIVSNSFGSITSSTATLTVNSFNATPVPRISLPLTTQRWNVGDVIQYAGSATDAEDGALPASSFVWEVRQFHQDCPTCAHWHPGPDAADGVLSGSFIASNGGEPSPNIWIRLMLFVRDSQGRIGADSVDIFPNKVNLTFNSLPSNIALSAGGKLNETTPFTREFVVNAPISISAPSNTTIGGIAYTFSSWSQGGSASTTLLVPAVARTYTANYAAVATQSPYGGIATSLPGTILAQNFDLGGQAIAYNDLTSGNSGNQYRTTEAVDIEPCSEGQFNVGWISTGEWLEYTVNVTQTGSYSAILRVSTPFAGRTAHLELNGVNISGSIAIPMTGGYQVWQNAVIPSINLTAGTHVLRLAMDSDNFNISRMIFSLNNSNTPPTISLTSPTNNSSYFVPASVTINASANDANGSVSKVEFFQGSTKIGEDLTAPFSFVWNITAVGTYSITAIATDDAGATATSTPISISVNAAPAQSPYGGIAKPIPGRIEAEEYDLGGNGIAFSDGTSSNFGGVFRSDGVDIQPTGDVNGTYNVGWTTPGEWLEYTVNVTTSGNYTLSLRIATIFSGRTCSVEMDGVNISGTISVPNTGGWQTWQTISIPNVNLTAGTKVMRLNFIGDGINVNFLNFSNSMLLKSGIEEVNNTASQVTVFPNPTSGILNLSTSNAESITDILILNAMG